MGADEDPQRRDQRDDDVLADVRIGIDDRAPDHRQRYEGDRQPLTTRSDVGVGGSRPVGTRLPPPFEDTHRTNQDRDCRQKIMAQRPRVRRHHRRNRDDVRGSHCPQHRTSPLQAFELQFQKRRADLGHRLRQDTPPTRGDHRTDLIQHTSPPRRSASLVLACRQPTLPHFNVLAMSCARMTVIAITACCNAGPSAT